MQTYHLTAPRYTARAHHCNDKSETYIDFKEVSEDAGASFQYEDNQQQDGILKHHHHQKYSTHVTITDNSKQQMY